MGGVGGMAVAAAVLGLGALADALLPPPPPATNTMTPLKKGTTVGGAALVVADVISDYTVVVGYALAGQYGYFAVAASVLLASSLANAAIAANAFYPGTEGLDFGSMDEVVERFRYLPKWWLLQQGYYSRKIPAIVAALEEARTSDALWLHHLSGSSAGCYPYTCARFTNACGIEEVRKPARCGYGIIAADYPGPELIAACIAQNPTASG